MPIPVLTTKESAMSDLWRLSASQTANLIRLGKLSATEAAEAALARLDQVNPILNAVVDCRPDEVLARAKAVDEGLTRGAAPGPLTGVPVTIKVNIDQAGHATTNGLTANRNLIAEHNNPVVDNLLAAGAVIVGRTNTPAFSCRYFTSNRLHGRTFNPRDRKLTPGGSSGGAAAAVAAGIGAIGHGNDIGGSIRYPAYACGIHGLRPSVGRVPTFNASGPERTLGSQIMSVQGPLARTIQDIRLGLLALAVEDARDPWWSPAPPQDGYNPQLAAVCLRPDGLEIAPEVEKTLLDSADRLRDAGWTVELVDTVPPLREAALLQPQIWVGAGVADYVADARAEGDEGAIVAMEGMAELVGDMTLKGYSDLLTRRATLVRAWQLFLQRYPVVVLPVSADLPFEDDFDLPAKGGFRQVFDKQIVLAGLPVIGVPALSVATGMVGRAPVGVHVVAGRFREDLCLAAGEALEARGTPPMPIDPVA
jgi:amidase